MFRKQNLCESITRVTISKLKIQYQGVLIQYVTNFKCLGIHIGTKLEWKKFIEDRLQKVRQPYSGRENYS